MKLKRNRLQQRQAMIVIVAPTALLKKLQKAILANFTFSQN